MNFNLNFVSFAKIFRRFRHLFVFSPQQGGRPALAFGSKNKNLLGIALNLLANPPKTQVFRWLPVFVAIQLIARPGFYTPWGKDADLKRPAPPPAAPEYSLGTDFADIMIRFHQQVISPVDGPRSHYKPSSSNYMQQAMHRYGFFRGFIMGCDRLLRENDEEWVYRTIEYEGQLFKYDPAIADKYR